MRTAVAKGMSRTLVKGFVALLMVLMSGLVPAGMAMAADLAFPIQFIPVYSQDENIFGVFTDTRVIVFNPSQHCPIAIDPDCIAGVLAALPKNTELEMLWFDSDEDLIAINSRSMTPFASVTITGPTIPSGTGTAIFVNLLSGISFPIIAFFHPISSVVEIGVKLAPGPILDPAGSLFALTASEAQVIPAIAGEFPRVELTAGPGGAGLPFPAGWETVIAETCLIGGVLQNYFVTQAEVFLGDILIPCTGLDDFGPDLAVFTPDDGGLLGTLATPLPLGVLSEGYNRMAIDVNTLGPIAGATLFYGQAFVIAPGGVNRQAYSYNMQANFFYPFTALQRPTAARGAAVVTDGVTRAVDILGELSCIVLARSLGQTVGVTTGDLEDKDEPFEIPGVATCDSWFVKASSPE